MYQETDLKGWDYVLAVSQKEINQSLRDLFEQGLLLEKEQIFEMPLLGENGVLKLTLDAPEIEAQRDSLKLCKVMFSLEKIESLVGDQINLLASKVKLNLITSLASFSLRTDTKKRNQVYIDIHDDNAVYEVHFDGQQGLDQELISRIFRKTLLRTNPEYFVLSGVTLGENPDPFTPCYAEFSFVKNLQDPNQSALIVAASVDPDGPKVDQRLFFNSNILQDGLPATYWVGNRLFLERIVKSGFDQQFKQAEVRDINGQPPNMIFVDGRKLQLAERIPVPTNEVDCEANVTQLVAETVNNSLQFYSELEIKKISRGLIYNSNFFNTVKTTTKMEVILKPDKNSFDERFSLVKQETDRSDDDPMGWFGKINLYHWWCQDSAENSMAGVRQTPMADYMGNWAADINENAKSIPALARLMVGGKINFNGVSILHHGSMCIGIDFPNSPQR
jgi:hypothetical protein